MDVDKFSVRMGAAIIWMSVLTPLNSALEAYIAADRFKLFWMAFAVLGAISIGVKVWRAA